MKINLMSKIKEFTVLSQKAIVEKSQEFTFLVVGLTIASLKASSGFIFCKFSYKIATFLSLSQPVGLKKNITY